MKTGETLSAVGRRFCKPKIWGSLLVLSALNIILIMMSSNWKELGFAHRTLLPIHALLQSFFLLVASPMPWQWTADSRPMAPWWRGIIQLLVFLCFPLFSSWILTPTPSAGIFARLIQLGFIVCLFGSVGWFMARRESQVLEQAELQRCTQEAVWEQLRAQLSPHVLLNALNGLAQLVVEDAQAAAKGMRDLADVHRRLVDLSRRSVVNLGEERALTERYLAVEALRLEGRFTVEWIWSNGVDRVDVIPFLIQPLVENAIKHGIAPSERGGQLVIVGDYEREWVRLEVRNTGLAPGVAPPGTGIGLRNLKSRLELAYHNRASLELKREGKWTVATLILPLKPRHTELPHE